MPPSAQIAQQLQQYDANKVTSASALNDALAQYNIPEIRQNVANLRTTVDNTTNALNNVDPSVTGRTQQSLVTEAQRQRMVANERAPIATNLDSENKAYGNANSDLNDKMSQATTLATNRVNDYNTGRAALQSEYDTAYKAEQDAAAAEAARQAAAEQQREFNITSAQNQQKVDISGAKSAASSSTPTPGSSQRSDGGFNFQDANGKAISARLYAQLTGTNFNTLLKKMSAAGDKGASDVLKNGGSAKSYKALTWD